MGHANTVLGPGGHNLVNICAKCQFLISPAPAPVKLHRKKGNILYFDLATLGRSLQPV